jgi:hypothetical protein
MVFDLIYILVISICFGFWQHSVLAALVMAGVWLYAHESTL